MNHSLKTETAVMGKIQQKEKGQSVTESEYKLKMLTQIRVAAGSNWVVLDPEF